VQSSAVGFIPGSVWSLGRPTKLLTSGDKIHAVNKLLTVKSIPYCCASSYGPMLEPGNPLILEQCHYF